MTERQRNILITLVDSYLKNGRAPSSAQLSEMLNEQWSSATIRNELAVLAKKGYLKQDTRVSPYEPTEEGVSLYFGMKLIEALLKNTYETNAELRQMEAATVEDVLVNGVQWVSEDVGSPSIGIAFAKPMVSTVRFIPITATKVALVVVFDDGTVESGIANLEMAVTEASMELLSSLLDELIKNKSCSDAADIIKDKTDLFDKKYGPVRDVLYRLLKQSAGNPKAVYFLGDNPSPETIKEINTVLEVGKQNPAYVYNRILWRIDLGVLLDKVLVNQSVGMFADISTSKVMSFMGTFVRRDKDLEKVIDTLKGVKDIARKEIQKICD